MKLSSSEEQTLNEKLERLDSLQQSPVSGKNPHYSVQGNSLKPQPYKENASKREIVLSEKELNALLARNTDLSKKLAIDLSDDLASAKLLLPMDEDFPLLGGKQGFWNAFASGIGKIEIAEGKLRIHLKE